MNSSFLQELVQNTVQVGDAAYLDLLLKKHSISSAADIKKTIEGEGQLKFNPVKSVCRGGNADMAKYLKEKANYSFSEFRGADQETCLHLAVQRKNFGMMKMLIKEDASQLNQQTKRTGETPMFYALEGKHGHADRLRMVQLLLDEKTSKTKIDLGLQNKMGQTCYEAHVDAYGGDEAAAFVEKIHRASQGISHDKSQDVDQLFMRKANNDENIFAQADMSKA